jgi:hypothetical protein
MHFRQGGFLTDLCSLKEIQKALDSISRKFIMHENNSTSLLEKK